MAILELQMRQDLFLGIIRAELARTPMSSETIESFAALGKLINGEELLIERVEFPEIVIVKETPVGHVPIGSLGLKVTIRIFTTTYSAARNAGHLAKPEEFPSPTGDISLWIHINLNHSKVFEFKGVSSSIKFPLPKGKLSLEFGIPLRFTATNTAIIAQDGVVAVRMGSDTEDLLPDPQPFFNWWAGNRLGSAHWGVFVPGDFFAHELAKKLAERVKLAEAQSTNPKLKITRVASGTWLVPALAATASTELDAINALPLNFDASIAIEATTRITPKNNNKIELNTRIQWGAADFITTIASAIGQGLADDAINSTAPEALDTQELLTKGENFLIYGGTYYLDAPKSHSFNASISSVTIDTTGLIIKGSLQIRPLPTATWSASLPHWEYKGDCHSRHVDLNLTPPTVQIVGADPYYFIRIVSDIKSLPILCWQPLIDSSWPYNNPIILNVSLLPAPTVNSTALSGVHASAWLYTNLGVRWIDFSIIPTRPKEDQREILSRTADLISNCMAISDRWSMGEMNLDWIVDPPPEGIPDFGNTLFREWAIYAHDIRETETFHVTSIDPQGRRTGLRKIPVRAGMLGANRIFTSADETIEVRTDVAMSAPMPRIMQRWISPQHIIPVEKPVKAFSVEGRVLHVLYEDDTLEMLRVEEDCVTSERRVLEGRTYWERASLLNRFELTGVYNSEPLDNSAKMNSVAVVHQNKIILGIASPFRVVVNKSKIPPEE
jgi:hypothetical protein